MSGFVKALGVALWERVAVAHKSTFLGIVLVAADVLVTQLQVAALPQWAHALVGVAATVLALYRGKAAPIELKPAP